MARGWLRRSGCEAAEEGLQLSGFLLITYKTSCRMIGLNSGGVWWGLNFGWWIGGPLQFKWGVRFLVFSGGVQFSVQPPPIRGVV